MELLRFILYKFAYLVIDFPEIKEIDINPFSIDEKRGFVIDSKIILDKDYLTKNKKSVNQYSHLVISPYPKEYIKEIKLKNCKNILLRPIKPEDESMEAEMLTHFSKQTQRFRFFGPMKDITHEMLIRYTQIDYDREMAIIAEAEEKGKKRMFGVVRLINNPYDNSAEFAIAVADPYQDHGLGSIMMDYILEIAKERGIKKVFAYFLKENEIMKYLFEIRGFNIFREEKVYRAEKGL